MKRIVIFFAIVFFSNNLISQTVFQTHIQDSNDKKVFKIFEDTNTYLVSGSISNSVRKAAYIAKLDSMGSLVKTRIVSDPNYDIEIVDAIKGDTNYVFIGFMQNEFINSDSYLWVLVTDKELNTLSKNSFFIDTANIMRYASSVYTHKGTILIAAIYEKINIFDFKSYLFEISPIGDSLNSNINNYPDTSSLFCNIMETSNNTYKVIAASFFMFGANQVVQIDSNLNYISHTIIPTFHVNATSMGVADYGKKYYALFNYHDNDRQVIISKFNAANDSVLDTKILGVQDTIDYAAYRGLSQSGKYLYMGYTSNSTPTYTWYGIGQESKFVVTKLDTALNIIWEKRIGLPGMYLKLLEVKATKDGGCILMGTTHDNSAIQKNDILIVKLDSNGTTTWTQNIKVPQVKFTIFPNPTKQSLNIVLDSENQSMKEYQIFDLQGKLILQKQIDAKQYKIDVQSLARGVYIIKGITNSGAQFQSRFVKE